MAGGGGEMKVVYITTMDWLNPISLGIAASTRNNRSHSAIGFELDDADVKELRMFYPEYETIGLWTEPHKHNIIYFESHLKKDKRTGQTGTRGPYWLDHITEWAAEQPGTRAFDIEEIRNLTVADKWQCLYNAEDMVGKYGYDTLQLLFNLRGMIRGAGIPLNWRNKDKVTCVEYVARCLPPAWAVKYLGLGYQLYEEYTPAGKCGLREMVKKVPACAPVDVGLEFINNVCSVDTKNEGKK